MSTIASETKWGTAIGTAGVVMAGRPVKVLICGESGAGKSCLMLRYCDDSFSTSFIATIGLDFKVKRIMVDGVSVRVQIWDAAGQERFRAIMPAYFRGAHALLLCYDVTDRQSFEGVRTWAQHIASNITHQVPCAIVANKIDLAFERVVGSAEGRELAAELGCQYFETSAKARLGVEAPFDSIVRQALSRNNLIHDDAPRTKSVRINVADTSRKDSSLAECLDCHR